MKSIKHKWNNFKVMYQLVVQFKRRIFFWMLLRILVSTLVPFAQLLTMSQVIAWLGAGVTVDIFLTRLASLMIGIVLLTAFDAYLENKFDYLSETFRISLYYPMSEMQFSYDYPLIIGPESSKRFQTALLLVDYRQTTLGRVFDE